MGVVSDEWVCFGVYGCGIECMGVALNAWVCPSVRNRCD